VVRLETAGPRPNPAPDPRRASRIWPHFHSAVPIGSLPLQIAAPDTRAPSPMASLTFTAPRPAAARAAAGARLAAARALLARPAGLPALRRAAAPAAPRRAPAPAAASAAAAAPAVAAAAVPPAAEGIKWGADLKKLATCVGVGALVWFAPSPAGVAPAAWHLLAIFLGTIVGIITQPLPLGAVAMLGLGATMMTGTLTFAQAFSAFSSEIPWLIAIAFWLSGGFIRSGLGSRIAYGIVALFGKTTLGLTYSLVFAEALLAPAIPSVAARAGGLFLPLAKVRGCLVV
jgi:hypothetical protein